MHTPDPFALLAAAFSEAFQPQKPLTPEEKDAKADEYQREQIATARSEAGEAQAFRSYAK